MNPRPVLIEGWLPFPAIGAESLRDASAARKPPLNRLHVWWARRPLTISRAAILASLLPDWSADWPDPLRERFPDPESYRAWFVHLLGIRGDPVQGRKEIQWAKEAGIKIEGGAYGGHPRAFTVNPEPDDLKLMGDLLEQAWGTREVAVMDVTAGGGSIPFEALRYGFTTYANELNPVASVILHATLDYPARYGKGLAADIQKWGTLWAKRIQERLAPYFKKDKNENIFAYLWARTVACPTTGKPVPLSPNWWLSGEKNIAAQIVVKESWDAPRFVIGEVGKEALLPETGEWIRIGDPEKGTISRGVGLSPWTGEAIEGDYIKAEAQAGRMGQILYGIANKSPGKPDFRAPTPDDLACAALAERALAENLPRWEAMGLVPNEAIPVGNKTDEPRRYGITHWQEMFSPRQLLAMLTFLETLQEVGKEVRQQLDPDRAAAVETYLGVALNKCPNYSSYLASWNAPRAMMRSVFDRHDFAFKWTYGEFDAAANLLPWAVNQIVDAYSGLVDMLAPTRYPLWGEGEHSPLERLHFSQGSAAALHHLPDGVLHNITFDPPYYDNVMYAELSDFFYVWLKRSVGHLFPAYFGADLANKDDEAVANVARFADAGRKKKDMAEKDYERKMFAIFRECARVLRPDGVLTVMFTHKRVEAWDTLASALIEAGFVVKASWPVHTESEHSLHQAKKNAAASTILLTCRKRPAGGEPVWWDDIQGEVRRVARAKAAEFAEQGISGVDLYISTFGPALSVISAQWPVLTSTVDPKTGELVLLRPETALDLARGEVVALRKQGLLLGREITFDPITDWYLMAWDAFKAAEFPYDEARKLAIALGVDLDSEIRGNKNLVARKSGSVVLQTPAARRKRGMVDPELAIFEHKVDAVHTALLVLAEDGQAHCKAFLERAGLLHDSAFKQAIQAMLNAIPRGRVKGKWVRPEAEWLEALRALFYDDLRAPLEEAAPALPTQMALGEADPDADAEIEAESDDADDDGEE